MEGRGGLQLERGQRRFPPPSWAAEVEQQHRGEELGRSRQPARHQLHPVRVAAMGKSFAEKLPAFLRTYKTEKFIRVDVPRVGIFFRVCQFFAFLLVLAQLYLNDGWALSEVPGGISNAWDEPGTMMSSTNDVHAKRAATEYCSNASYSYSSEGYSYVAPQCEALLPAELTSKTSNTVFYTTAYIETVTRGWACSSATAAAQRTTCQSGGGVFYERLTGQCGCVTQRAVYPLAVEEMGLAFEHSYDTSEKVGFRGSSASSEGNPDDAMYSMVFFPNGSTTRFEAGEVVRLPLTEWIAAANITLKGRNDKVNPDPTGVLPPKRTTGLLIKVDIQYTNADRNSPTTSLGACPPHLTALGDTWQVHQCRPQLPPCRPRQAAGARGRDAARRGGHVDWHGRADHLGAVPHPPARHAAGLPFG